MTSTPNSIHDPNRRITSALCSCCGESYHSGECAPRTPTSITKGS